MTYQEALDQHGSKAAAARALGLAKSTFKDRLTAEQLGRVPANDDGFKVIGRSTLRNADGEVVAEWTKTSLDREREEEARQAAFVALSAALPRAPTIEGPATTYADLCNVYSYFDYHIGMLSWHKESGDDWDLTIAERRLQASYQRMVEQSPPARKAVVVLGGDWLHTDGLLPVTPASKHILDADGRFSKIVQVAVRGARFLCALALEKHEEVELVVMEGNHDESSSGVWLRHMFTLLYENEPRLSVNDSELPFYVSVWGDTMLGFHHGHKVKNEQLPLLFAAQFPKIWGATTKREIHCGHRHHKDEKEYNGVTVIQHPTLAARDAYAARGGWIADRAVQAITYHKSFGQVGRVVISPEMLQAA